MKTVFKRVGVTFAVIMALLVAAAAPSAAQGLQDFRIAVTDRGAWAFARGPGGVLGVNGIGTAVSTSDTTYTLIFPDAPDRPVSITLAPMSTTETLAPRTCTAIRQESGTFVFNRTIVQVSGDDVFVGYVEGTGPYTSTSVVVYGRLSSGACNTAAPPVSRTSSIYAQATEIVAVL